MWVLEIHKANRKGNETYGALGTAQRGKKWDTTGQKDAKNDEWQHARPRRKKKEEEKPWGRLVNGKKCKVGRDGDKRLTL